MEAGLGEARGYEMASVAGFNLTPVKSTALLAPSEVELGARGAIGDRRFLFARAGAR